MIELYNAIFENRFFGYALLPALPVLLGFIHDRLNIRILGCIAFYYMFHYFWGFSYAYNGPVVLAIMIALALLISYRLITAHNSAVERHGHRGWAYSIQFILMLACLMIALRATTNLVLGKTFRTSGESLSLQTPLAPGVTYNVISGGYKEVNTADFANPAKTHALHFASGANSLAVIAPCEGSIKQVIVANAAAKGISELLHTPETQRYGTSIVMNCFGNEDTLILSNLDPATVQVKEGETVQLAAPLARTGRTEYRGRAGLILHAVENRAESLDQMFVSGAGVAIRIENEYFVKNDTFSPTLPKAE